MRPVASWLVVAAALSACATSQDNPQAVVRRAGEALRTRNRAEFYDLVDLGKLGPQLFWELARPGTDPHSTMPTGSDSGIGDMLGRQLAPFFKSIPESGESVQATATTIGRELIGLDLSVRGLGKGQRSDSAAVVPLSLQLGRETTPVTVSVQLEKQSAGWRIVGIEGLGKPVELEFRRLRPEMHVIIPWEPGPITAMISDLRNLVTSQEAYFADHARYASSLSQMGKQYVPSRGRHRYDLGRICDGVGRVSDQQFLPRSSVLGLRGHAGSPAYSLQQYCSRGRASLPTDQLSGKRSGNEGQGRVDSNASGPRTASLIRSRTSCSFQLIALAGRSLLSASCSSLPAALRSPRSDSC